jgi:hypothetical protein
MRLKDAVQRLLLLLPMTMMIEMTIVLLQTLSDARNAAESKEAAAGGGTLVDTFRRAIEWKCYGGGGGGRHKGTIQ